MNGRRFRAATFLVAGAAVAAGASAAAAQQAPTGGRVMTEARLTELIRGTGQDLRASGRMAEFTFDGVRMACIWDVAYDRMRIVAPVVEDSVLTEQQHRILLSANYHSALDARYATSDGVLFAAFIHPLSPLSEEELRSALRQVASLVKTFGTTYSSGELIFGQPPN